MCSLVERLGTNNDVLGLGSDVQARIIWELGMNSGEPSKRRIIKPPPDKGVPNHPEFAPKHHYPYSLNDQEGYQKCL